MGPSANQEHNGVVLLVTKKIINIIFFGLAARTGCCADKDLKGTHRLKKKRFSMYQSFEELEKNCKACEKCQLCKTRHNVVFGVGNKNAEVLFIGEGPGENEDLQGEPFVGRGGQLLDKMLNAVDLDRRKNIYIANIVKCRPPQNRDPLQEEQDACIGWLRNQVALIRPKIIVCLGRVAAMKIIRQDIKITKEHGIFFDRNGVLLMATLHPAALRRNPANKPEAFNDFLKLREKIKEVCGEEFYTK